MIRLWRNRCEPVRSPPNHENHLPTIESLLLTSARHGRAAGCFGFVHRSAAGAFLQGQGIIVSEGERGNNSRSISEYNDFYWIYSIQLNAHGVSPPLLWLPQTVILSAGGVWGDRLMSSSSSYQCCIRSIVHGILPIKDMLKSDHG